MTTPSDRFEQAMARFDHANRADPQTEVVGGVAHPKALLYARRMTAQLARFASDASEALRLAIRCQHLRRWEIPRDTYPPGRLGYKQWRAACAAFHAEAAASILRDVGYDDAMIARVQSLVQKRRLKRDPETQTLEDVACLVFLRYYFDDFRGTQEEDKLVDILRKTWVKMSPEGREAALALDLSTEATALMKQALDTS
jgi:hypothetical protein